ncbi:hypothetical protein ACFQU9_37510 [Actinomadura namibiensis]|uniref:hypothetical protein n=1 Tax=Actinomadura kijaniata TaxID=46161 RepID=UPI003611CDB7
MGAGRVLTRISVAPALLIVAWLAVSLPLLMAGWFRPLPVIGLFLPLAAGALWLGLRERPGQAAREPVGTPRWATAGVLAAGLVFLVVELALVSEQIVPRRDPASYVQFAVWLSEHGSLPIPQDRAAFGGGDPALTYGSPAFYQRGESIVPQFMAGLPMVLALGHWLGGMTGLLAVAPVLGACAVVAFGGLAARLVGPRWAPAAALLLAVTLPMLWAARSSYSELVALLLFLGGLSLLHDARNADVAAARGRAFLAGLALGLIVLVRIDGLRDVLPVLAFAGLLTVTGVAWGVPTPFSRRVGYALGGGLLLGVGAGLAEGFVLSRPYLEYLSDSLDPLLMISAAAVVLTAALVLALRNRRTGPVLLRAAGRLSRPPFPTAVAVLTVLVTVGFAVRPLVQTVVRVPVSQPDKDTAAYIEFLQRFEKLPVDGARQYYENSLIWVAWYAGVPALLAATIGSALLARRLLRGRDPQWLLPLAVVAWTSVTTLWRPGITPDQPWASRRFLPVVIPGLLLIALWATARAVRAYRRNGHGPRATRAVAVGAVTVLAVPALGMAIPSFYPPVERGSVAGVAGLCRQIGGGKRSVVIVDKLTGERFSQVVRGMCGRPAARTVAGARPDDVRRIIDRIRAAGRTPVVLGAKPDDVAPYGRPRHALKLRARQDGHTLVSPPHGTWTYNVDVWLAEPAP